MYNYYRIYYTLDDIRKALGGSYVETAGPYAMFSKSFSAFLNDCLDKFGFTLHPGFTETTESNNCFRDYIWPRFYQEAIIYVYSDEDESFVEKFCRTKVGQIMAWWQSSSEKYSMLIQNLNNNKAKLLDDVRSYSSSRFNDTPQNSGDFSDDQHTSNITTTTSSSNAGTMMARLNEIEDNIKQLYIDWSNEFRKFITWSVN